MTSLSLRLFHNSTSSQKILKLSKSFLVHFALISLIFEQLLFVASASAQALPINPDGTTNTQVTQTASGVDQVNIAAPNANGLSHNKFTDYNVNTGGQVINNFSGHDGVAAGSVAGSNAVTQTQIGGLVTVNPNFSDGVSAKVILNEVTSGNNTQLLGYTEIAGSKADLIIANPNGIACRGCGFLSTSHLTFIAGSSNFDSSGNLGFNLKEQTNPNLLVPLITVDGLGLDVTNTTSTDIIASSIKLLANIYGSDNTTLTLKSGEGRYDYQTKEIANSTTSLASGTTPLFAIDASSLAKIQSGRIFIVATKEGVGVNMTNEVLASNEVNISSNGDVYYANVSAGDKVSITSTKNISSLDSNSIISAPNLTLQSGAEFKNLGSLSAYNLDILNSGTLTNSGQVEALTLNLSNISNINNSGSFYGENSLNISGTNLTNNSGASIFSPKSYSIALTGLLTNSGTVSSGSDLTILTNQLTNNSNSEISAQNNLSFAVASSVTNSGNLIANNALNVTANSLINSGVIQSDDASTFNLTTLTTSQNSSIYSGKNLSLTLSGSLTNYGEISTSQNLTITGAASLTNRNQILAIGDLSIAASDLSNSSDAIISSISQLLSLTLSSDLQNAGEISAATSLTADANNFTNSGIILSGTTLTLKAANLLTNSGNLQSTQNSQVSATSLNNSGSIKSFATSTINTTSLTNQIGATIFSSDDLAITAALNNSGSISAQNNFTLTSSTLNNAGIIYSANIFNISAVGDLTNSGTLYSDGVMLISGASLNNSNSGQIFSAKDFSVNLTADFTNLGTLQTSQAINATIAGNAVNSGAIVANTVTFSNSDDVTNSGTIASDGDLTLLASNLSNSGTIQSGGNSQITLSNNLTTFENSLIYSGATLAITAGNSLTNAGEISALGSAILTTNSSVNNSGSILSNANLTITAADLNNQNTDSVIASINKSLTLNISNQLTNVGTIFAKENLTLSGAPNSELSSVTNSGDISFNQLVDGLKVKNFTNSGSISSNSNNTDQDLIITATSSFNNSGELSSQSNFTITSQNIFTNSGTILSVQNLALNSDLLTNSGEISAQNNLAIASSGDLTNSNKILANGQIIVSAGSFTNDSSGTIASLTDLLTLTLSGNLQNDGEISAATNLTISSNNFTNLGNILSSADLNIGAANTLTNSSIGNFQSAGDLSLSAASLDNSGSIKSFSAGTINASSFTNYESGVIFSADDLAIVANLGTISNSGIISSQNDLTASSTALSNSGSIYAANNFSITNAGDLTNLGTLYSDGAMLIGAANLNNSDSGQIFSAKNFGLTATDNLTNLGILQVTQNLNLSIAANTINSGTIISGGSLTSVNVGDVTNSGTLASDGTISLSAANLTNSDTIQSGGNSQILLSNNLATLENSLIYSGANLNFTIGNSLITAGEISAFGDITAAANSSVNNSGNILANNNLTITSTDLNNQSTSATIASINKSLTLNLSNQLTNVGTIFAKENLAIAELDNVSNSGDISFDQLINGLKVKNLTNSGNISSAQDLTITASDNFTNSGELISQNNFTINSQNIFTNSGTILSVQNLALNSTSLSNSGEISAQGTLAITNSGDITNTNNILANGALTIASNNLTNSGAIASLANLLTLTLTNNLENSGEISAATNLTTNSKNLTNSGNILSSNNLTIVADNQLNNSSAGNLQSTNDLSATATSLNNSGSIKSFAKSTINVIALTNSIDALIFANNDSAIVSTDSLLNYGSILSSAKLSLNIGQTTNGGEIFSNGDLSAALTNTLSNEGSISSLGNINISSTSSIINSDQILSSGSLTIAATNLTNSNIIQSNSQLTLNLTNLTNSKNILSNGAFSINASGNISNGGTLQSADSFTINAASFTNAASSLVLAGGNLSITSTSISNADTKPTGTTITAGLVSANGTITLQTDILNNNSGIIAGKSTTLNALNNSSVTLLNTLGSFISTAAITLNLGNLDYTITGTVTAANIDITANNITNQGNVTASDYIALNATGNSGISGSGNITNGYVSNDVLNANVVLAAGSYVNLTAKNNINNYGTISSTTDLTLTSTNGGINNYNTITGGDGETIINVANSGFTNFSSNSILTSNNNLTFNTKDLTNSGEISVANDLTANITGNFNNNSTALIWSGNDLTFNVVGNFINNQADIYANNNLTIQKNTSTNTSENKANSVQNISGNIETYNGDIIIKAGTLENKRTSMKLQSYVEWQSGCHFHHHECHFDSTYTATISNSAGALSQISSGQNLNIETDTFTNDASNIFSVGNLSINSSTLNNNSYLLESYVKSAYDWWGPYRPTWGNIAPTNYYYETFSALIKSGGSLSGSVTSQINNTTIAQNSSVSNNAQQSKSTTFNKVDSYTLGQTGVANVDLSSIAAVLSSSSAASSGSELNISEANSTTKSLASVGSQQISTNDILNPLANSGVSGSHISSSTSSISGSNSALTSLNSLSEKDLTKGSIASPSANSGSDDSISPSQATVSKTNAVSSTPDTAFSGSYKINLDPASTKPLVESRSKFTDVSKFFGSAYYFDQLGLNGAAIVADIDRQSRNPEAHTRMLGDAFVESNLIRNQLMTLTNDSLLLSKNNTQSDAEIKTLIDNSIAEMKRLGLNAEDVAMKGLTASQANSLSKDIVTFETTSVNGINVLAPKIYLSLDTRNRLLGTTTSNSPSLATGSTIFSGGDLTINSPTASLLNNGTISSNGNLTLNIANLTSTSKTLTAISPTASITASSLNSNFNSPSTVNTAIKSLGNLSITASDGISLKNTVLNSGGKISLSAAKDITLANDKSFSVASPLAKSLPTTISISSIKDDAATTRSSAIFNAASDIQLTSSGSINIANNYLNTGGSIFMSAASDINNSNYTIKASNNVVMSATNINNIHKDLGYSSTSGATTNETRIEAGSMVSLNATNDINNIGATIKAGDLLYLTAGNNINNRALVNYKINGSLTNSDGSTITESQALTSGTRNIRSTLVSQGNLISGGDLVLVAGNDINNAGSNITATGSSYLEATAGSVNITTAALRDKTYDEGGRKKKHWVNISDSTSNLESTVTSGGDLELISAKNINIAGSKISATENLSLTASDAVSISEVKGTSSTKTSSLSGGSVAIAADSDFTNTISNISATKNTLSDGSITDGSLSISIKNNIKNIGTTLQADGDLTLISTAGSITNIFNQSSLAQGVIRSNSGNLTLSAAGDIKNIGSKLSALGNLNLISTGGNILSTAVVKTNDAKLLALSSDSYQSNGQPSRTSGNIQSSLLQNASIDGGSINISANQDVTNLGAKITADKNTLSDGTTTSGNVTIAAGDDINVGTLQLHNRSEVAWGGGRTRWGKKKASGVNISDSVVNIGSEIDSDGMMSLASNGTAAQNLDSKNSDHLSNINITGSNLSSTKSIAIAAADEVNIKAAQNTNFSQSTSSRKGLTVSKSSIDVKSSTTNVKSELNSGDDISITSGADTNLIGVKLAATNATINAGKELNIFSVADQSYSYSNVSKSRDFSGIAKIAASGGFALGFSPSYEGFLNAAILGAAVGLSVDTASATKSNSTTSDKTSNVASILEATGNLTLVSNKNLTISGSSLSGAAGNLTLNSAGDVNIKAAQNTSYEESSNYKKGFSFAKSSTDIRSSVTNVHSELTAGNDIVIVSGASVGGLPRAIADINIEGGNLVAGSDLTLNSSGEVNIFAVKDTSYHYSESTKSKMDAGKIAAGGAAMGLTGALVVSQADKKSQSQTTQDEIISASKLQAGNDLTITAKDNLGVIGSIIKSGGDMILQSDKSVSILSGQNFHLDQSTQSKISLTNGKISEKESTKITQVASEVEAGTGLLIMSGNGTNIGSSNITTTSGDAAIVVGKYVDDAGVEIYNKDAELNIFALKDSETIFERTDKWKVSLNDWTSIRNGHLPIKVDYNHLGKEIATESSVSSNLTIGGNLLINSASNSNIIASNILSTGDSAIIAGKMLVNGALQENDDANINIFSAKDVTNSEVKTGKITIDPKLTFNANGFNIGLGSGSYSEKDDYLEKNVASNLMIGGDLTLDAGNNITLLASNMLVNGNAFLTAKNKVNILAQETNSTSNTTAVSGANSLDFRIDSNSISAQATVELGYNDSENKNTDYVSSNVSAKSIAVNSGKDINILASNLLATDGDILLTSEKGNVNILSAQELKSLSSLNLRIEGGIKIGVTHNIGNTFDSFTALKSVNVDKVVKSLIGVTTNLLSGDSIDEILDGNEEGLNDLTTLLNAGGKGGSAGIMFHLEGEGDYIKQSDSTAKASSLIASNNVTIKAGLGGLDSADKSIGNIAATGSLIQAGNDINLTATNDINLKSSSNLSKYYNIGGSLYVDIPIIGAGFSLGGELHASRNKDTTYNNTKIEAGNNFTLNSGNDTNLIGANIAASNVTLNVQNNLSLESQQNINQYRSFAIGGGYGNANGGKSGNASLNYAKNDRKWVDDQTSIIGSNSVTINTGNNTNLVGAMIANIKADGTDGNNLTLNTKSLTYSNIYDQDKGRSFGVSASYSDKPTTNKPGTATTAKTQGGGNSSFNLNYASHEKEQTNHATIGGGTITTGSTITFNTDKLSSSFGSATSTTGGTINDPLALANLNRDITKAQEITKDTSVDPINVGFSLSWTNSVDENGNKTGGLNNPFTTKLNEWKALAAYPLSPLQQTVQGMTRDISVIYGDYKNIDPSEVETEWWTRHNTYHKISLKDEGDKTAVNQAVKDKKEMSVVINEDTGDKVLGIDLKPGKDPEKIDSWEQKYTLNTAPIDPKAVIENPSLLAGITKFFRNGVMNSQDEAIKNAIKQTGGFDSNGNIVLMYDPSFKNETQKVFGNNLIASAFALPVDLLKVNINYLGNGVLITGGAAQDQEFTNAVLKNATAQNPLFFANHSAGAARQYVNLLNADLNQFRDANGNSLVNIQLNGAPVYSPNAQQAANQSGANYLGSKVNNLDFVGNGLGANNGWIQFFGSTASSILLVSDKYSPHSSYYCQGSQCSYNQQPKPKTNQTP